MRYLKHGAGPPLILIHGLLGYSFSWRFTMPALAPHATVFAIDNLGFGLSPSTDGMDCSLLATAERVMHFADALGITDFDMLGSSYGGAVAIMAAALACERHISTSNNNSRRSESNSKSKVRRLILVGPVNPWSPHGKRLAPLIGSALGSALFRNTIGRWRAFDYFWLSRMFGDSAKIPPDSLNGYRIPVLKNNAIAHGCRVIKHWTADMAVLEAALPKARDYPTLLMWGTKDRAVDFRSAERVRQNFQHVKSVTFDGVGHIPYEEAPVEFNRALIEFLKDSNFASG
jgi:pimeloyl-ACP methyl ester carboxylesterase